jgi:hypothetical protein
VFFFGSGYVTTYYCCGTEVYEEFLHVAALLPTKHMERLSSPANWWELTPIKLYRYLEANFPDLSL